MRDKIEQLNIETVDPLTSDVIAENSHDEIALATARQILKPYEPRSEDDILAARKQNLHISDRLGSMLFVTQ
jgi:hypothetical protein